MSGSFSAEFEKDLRRANGSIAYYSTRNEVVGQAIRKMCEHWIDIESEENGVFILNAHGEMIASVIYAEECTTVVVHAGSNLQNFDKHKETIIENLVRYLPPGFSLV